MRKKITITFDDKFLELLSAQARNKFMTRSDYIRQAIAEKIDRDMAIRKNISGQNQNNGGLDEGVNKNEGWQRFFLN